MANKKTAAAAAPAKENEQKSAPVVTPATEENIVDQLRNKNLQSSEAVTAAIEQIQKDADENKKREAMHAIKKFEYKNMRALLELRKRRQEDKATKEYLTATKDTLDQYLAGKLTANEAEKKSNKDEETKRKAFSEIDKDFSEQINELQHAYPGYWTYTWDRCW